MTVFVALALTVLTFAFITYPLLKQRLSSVDSVEDEKLQELHSRRDTTYSMLKELEFDFQSGILTEEDYRDLEARYKRKAISILKNLDDVGKGADLEEEIEKQVLELRRLKGQFCPQCGAKCQEDDRFCSRCGTSLSQGESVD
ncbi:zinc ribbon domain-containing protein [Chloroflexota bacterium]